MEKIINNPGLQHLAEKVFFNLNVEDLKICARISQSSKQILKNPMFWLRKFGDSLSMENKKEWIKIIQLSEKNSKKRKAIISYLQWNLKKEVLEDLPCISTSPAIQEDFRKKILEICLKKELSNEDTEIVKGYAEIVKLVKILAPSMDNPNAPNNDGDTPTHWAAYHGHTEIVKILAPVIGHPNAPDKDGITPIHVAALLGHTEIIKILAPFTNNPNASNYKFVPICYAKKFRHTEMAKILKSINASRKRNAETSSAKPNKKQAKKF